MKRTILAVAVISALCFTAPSAWGVKGKSGGGGEKSGTMSVQVRGSSVRATPNYMGASVGKIVYGQQVKVVGEQGNWYRLESPGGWVPKSDLTKSKVAVDPDQKFAASGGRRDEVALAGKGFNPQVEKQFKGDNPDLQRAFGDVDRVENMTVPDSELKAFMKGGKLSPR